MVVPWDSYGTDTVLSKERAVVRPFLKFCIKNKRDEIYGDGFQEVKQIVNKIGYEVLLSHVVMYKKFPVL